MLMQPILLRGVVCQLLVIDIMGGGGVGVEVGLETTPRLVGRVEMMVVVGGMEMGIIIIISGSTVAAVDREIEEMIP